MIPPVVLRNDSINRFKTVKKKTFKIKIPHNLNLIHEC